ncbi:guanine nucleotide binding protein, alpha subunit [Mycena epipterygia]|nr:guanine nucleotide binding protein, alpha subunit [Mycena epipterygia]
MPKTSAKARSDAIDRQIMEDCKRYKREFKILLFGSHESGQSMLMKRMKIIHQGFDAGELVEYRTTIYRNVLDSAGTLARVVRQVGIGALEEGERAHAALLLAAFPAAGAADEDDGEAVEVGVDPVTECERVQEGEEGMGIQPGRLSARPGTAEAEALTPAADVLSQTNAMLIPVLADAIWHIARAPAVERLLDEFYLRDSVSYFFASIHRIAAPTYVPSEEDIIRVSTNSTAITETRLWTRALSICIIDVSGQRSERKKWIHYFESVTSIIFCTALSEYDQLEEERGVNRLRESLSLFESVINSRWFIRTSVILFLNKVDVFQRKLQEIPLERYFPEYTGGSDLGKAVKYILWRFMQENRARLSVYPHLMRATDMKNTRFVFNAVRETILQNALKDSGIL